MGACNLICTVHGKLIRTQRIKGNNIVRKIFKALIIDIWNVFLFMISNSHLYVTVYCAKFEYIHIMYGSPSCFNTANIIKI